MYLRQIINMVFCWHTLTNYVEQLHKRSKPRETHTYHARNQPYASALRHLIYFLSKAPPS